MLNMSSLLRRVAQGRGPGNPVLYSNLGELLRSLNATEEAAQVLERGLKVGHSFLCTHMHLQI
jgi:hypothetical protein